MILTGKAAKEFLNKIAINELKEKIDFTKQIKSMKNILSKYKQ